MSAVAKPWQIEPTDVVLQIPADASYLRVVRMVAATLVADDGFDVDEVDDVRMAVDELCAAVIETEPAAPVRVSLRLATHHLTVVIEADGQIDGRQPPIDELRAAVLGAVADEYDARVVDGRSIARFTKRSGVAAAGRGPASA